MAAMVWGAGTAGIGAMYMTFLRVLLHAVALQGTAVASAGHSGEYLHTGGGLTSNVMDSIISKLPADKPPLHSGLRDGNRLMHTVRLSGAYQADVPLILPSYTRLILDGSMEALPYKLGWTPGSAGAPNQTASMVSVKDGKMVSVEGGTWSCARWNSSAAQGNTSDVAAIFFDSTSFSFIRNLQIRACGGYSGGNNSASIGVARAGYVSGNIRIAGGQSNVVENVDSGYSSNRGIWVQSQKVVVSGGSYHHNDADGIDLDSSSSHNVIHNASFFMNARCGVFLEFSASYNTIVGNRMWSNHEASACTGEYAGSTQTHNVLIGNVLGPSDYPAGCPVAQRPCPSYCPVNDSCAQVVGLPCGTCHYIDQKDYYAHGMNIGASHGTIAVLNDLGGSQHNSASGRSVVDALVALNFNGSLDTSDRSPNTSAYAFNPSANTTTASSGAAATASFAGFEREYLHTGGGLTSNVMDSIISKLPPVTPPASGVRDGDSLMHTVRLSGAYQADVPLILPSYTRLILDGSMEALPYKLGWTPGSAGTPNMTAAIVSVANATMVSVEGGVWSCAKWNSSAAQGNTSDVTAIFFEQTSFSFIRNLKITSCGQYSGGPVVYNYTSKTYINGNSSAGIGIGRVGYTSGNIRVHGGQSNLIEGVESSYSSNRGIWAQTQKLVVSGGSYHHNDADGIDLDSSSSHNVIHNVTAFMNSRMGIFMEFTSGYNTIVDSSLGGNHMYGVTTGSAEWGPSFNVLVGNIFGPSDYPAGCAAEKRPCPSYCPVPKIFPCHYTDYSSYETSPHGFGVQGSSGAIAVLNNLGGSSSGALNERVVDGLIALNFNGTIDNSGCAKRPASPNSSVFSWNPGAQQ